MSLKETMMRTTDMTFSVRMRETFIPPTLLPVCCVCGLIRDDTRLSPDRELWVTHRTYHETHGVNPTELAHTHTYCQNCFTKVQDTTQQYFRNIGTTP